MLTIKTPANSKNNSCVHKCECKEGRDRHMTVKGQKTFFTKQDGYQLLYQNLENVSFLHIHEKK